MDAPTGYVAASHTSHPMTADTCRDCRHVTSSATVEELDSLIALTLGERGKAGVSAKDKRKAQVRMDKIEN
jgi:hypothetical protein